MAFTHASFVSLFALYFCSLSSLISIDTLESLLCPFTELAFQASRGYRASLHSNDTTCMFRGMCVMP